MQIVVVNPRLKTLSIQSNFEYPTKFDKMEMISAANSLEILTLHRLARSNDWTLLNSMKSLRILRMKLSDDNQIFLETTNWLPSDLKFIWEYLKSKDKTTELREKVREVITKFAKIQLPNVFFALYFKEEWSNENENYV